MVLRVILACSAAVFAAAGSTAASPAIRPAPGWIVVHRSLSEPDVPASMVLAVTRDDVAAARPLALFTSLERLSARGILVWAWTLGRHRSGFSRLAWPPRLAAFRIDHGWENQPSPRIQQRVVAGVVNGWDVDVRVYFGTQHPDVALRNEAAAELRRITLPPR